MPEYADLLFEVDSNVATITLNRPNRLNAISGPMLESLSQALRDADRDREVRVIVITGAGRGFCAGLDLKDLVAGTGIGSNGANGLANARFDLANSPPIVLYHRQASHLRDQRPGRRLRYGSRSRRGHPHRLPRRQARCRLHEARHSS